MGGSVSRWFQTKGAGLLSRAGGVLKGALAGGLSGLGGGALAGGVGAPIGAAIGAIGGALPGLSNMMSYAMQDGADPTGPQSVREALSSAAGGGAGMVQDVLSNPAFQAASSEVLPVLGKAIQGWRGGASFNQGLEGAGGTQIFRAMANAAGTALTNKSREVVGVDPPTALMQTGWGRQVAAVGKGEVGYEGAGQAVANHAASFGKQVLGAYQAENAGGGGGGGHQPRQEAAPPAAGAGLEMTAQPVGGTPFSVSQAHGGRASGYG